MACWGIAVAAVASTMGAAGAAAAAALAVATASGLPAGVTSTAGVVTTWWATTCSVTGNSCC